ncbi:retrotransposon protein [Cucumis melo var. makuwa]|uniref:Retrotransposon protein n=1 Tax=Cucumis melo var. makuwa TaxID=1194695 RepID=A0A5D3BZN6_CUCMM|nr:retrotransposon protein [Cucumis melo var. makuwa]
MSTSSRAPRHIWTKEKEGTLVECLMELVSMGDENLITSHHVVKRLLNKPFSYYDELSYVFDRDKATGRFAETFADDDMRASRPFRASEDRARSSKFKRKRGSQREVDVDNVYYAHDQTNNQLRIIVEWPIRALVNDNHVRTEFFRILRELPKLTSLDRALLQRPLLSRITTCVVSYSCLKMRGRAFVESSYVT